MKTLIALVAVSLLVLTGCTTDTSSTNDNMNNSIAVAYENTGMGNTYRLGTDMPAGQYYLTEGSDMFMRANNMSVNTSDVKNEVPMAVVPSAAIAPYELVNNTMPVDTSPTGGYAFFQDVALYPVGIRPVVAADATATYAPGLYKAGTDIPVGKYQVVLSPVNNQLVGYYSVWEGNEGSTPTVVEHKMVTSNLSRVVTLENGQYIESPYATLISM